MRLLLLINRDFPSYYALERLLPLIQGQTVRVLQTAQIGALAEHNPGIATQAPGGLAIAPIDAVNPCRAALQQAIAETAGGDAAVEAYPARHRNREQAQGPL